jgi:tetratricopeptide (TPR) repeat protein
LGDTEREADEEPVIVLALDGRYDLMHRRDFMRTAGAVAAAPLAGLAATPFKISDHEAAAATAEARQLAVAAEPLDLTPGDLAWLDQQVAALDELWRTVPLPTLFHRARALRQEIIRYLPGRHTEIEGLRLADLAGIVSAHLADMMLDLGYYDAAWTHTDVSMVHARAAGDRELLCVLAGERSRILLWQGRYDEAKREAQQGETFVRRGSAAAVRLYQKLAETAARAGDLHETRRALRLGAQAREIAATPTVTAYLCPISEAFWTMGSAGTLISIGEPGAAEEHARRAIELYESRPAGQRSPVNLMFASISLALTQRDPDAAARIGSSAIERYLAQPRRSQLVAQDAGELLAKLVPYPEVPEVRDFQERYRALVRDGVPGAATGGPCG